MVLVAVLSASAQTSSNARPVNGPSSPEIRKGQTVEGYSFRLFIAPNKSYGYFIFRNEKPVFHQPAYSGSYNDRDLMLTKKEQAGTAAMLAIEKIKKGMPPELSRDELKMIAAQ